MSSTGFATANFRSYFDVSTGSTQWKLTDSDYDYVQEIARSAYGDMLHDVDRNRKYHLAIEKAVSYRRMMYPHKPIHVLDIGTGAGLLAMLAAKAGVDSVTGCEVFVPVAKCAETVLAENGLLGKINLIPKRSTDLIVGSDMAESANLLVAELVDTELIGEAALATYKHAAENLLEPDATLVPYAADLYVQVVESPFLWSHNKLASVDHEQSSAGPFSRAFRRYSMIHCAGAPSVFDIQASELELVTDDSVLLDGRQIRCLLDKPLLVKRFNFTPPSSQIILEEAIRLTHAEHGDRLVARCAGVVHAFIVWWRLKMEPTNTVPDISTAPKWSGDPEYAWRDHWMQAVYFPRRQLPVQRGDPITIRFSHDSLSLWFDLEYDHSPLSISDTTERPVCDCGMHYSWSRNRIAQVNSPRYAALTENILQLLCSEFASYEPGQCCDLVVVSDCTILPLRIADLMNSQHPITNLFHVETSPYSRKFVQSIYEANSESAGVPITIFESVDHLIKHYRRKEDSLPSSIQIVAEPYASAGLLPWNSLLFHYARKKLMSAFPSLRSISLLCPTRMRIWGVLVDFEHLWKIRAPIGRACETINLESFDRLVQPAISQADSLVEPQPLWEYPARARSQPTVVFDIDFTSPVHCPSVSVSEGSFISNTSRINGIALWAEWLVRPGGSAYCAEDVWHSPAGPSSSVVPDQLIQWDASGAFQGTIIAPWQKMAVNVKSSEPLHITLFADFEPDTGEVSFRLNWI